MRIDRISSFLNLVVLRSVEILKFVNFIPHCDVHFEIKKGGYNKKLRENYVGSSIRVPNSIWFGCICGCLIFKISYKNFSSFSRAYCHIAIFRSHLPSIEWGVTNLTSPSTDWWTRPTEAWVWLHCECHRLRTHIFLKSKQELRCCLYYTYGIFKRTRNEAPFDQRQAIAAALELKLDARKCGALAVELSGQ